ncbi:MAG: hypothetical protein AB1Z98_24445 [Nannocystaceae bacterium]
MIISCPECAGPFEVPDEHIAALVQVQCPSCSFRMILDFAAANDPSLVEQGMRMASGFRSAADYRSSVAASPAEPVTPLPAVAEAPPPRVPSTTPAADEARPAAARADAPARPRVDTDEDLQVKIPRPAEEVAVRAPEPRRIDEDAMTMAPPGRDDVPPVRVPVVPTESAPQPSASTGTVVSPAPTAEPSHPSFDEAEDAPTVMVPPEAVAEMRAQRDAAAAREAAEAAEAAEADIELDVDTETEAEDSTPSGRDRLPPHTPPGRAKTTLADDTDEDEPETKPRIAAKARAEDEPRTKTRTKVDSSLEPPPRRRKRPRLEAFDDLEQDAPKDGMSTLGVIVVLVLLLLAGGLVGASMALEDTVDPRPLLEKLYRQYVKGETTGP